MNIILLMFLSTIGAAERVISKKSIFSSGRLLHDVQSSGLFKHQRDFLELWTKIPQNKVKQLYAVTDKSQSAESLKSFIRDNFENRSAVSTHPVSDWSSCHPLRQSLARWSSRVFLDCVARRWHDFSFKFSDDGVKYQSRHASIVLPQPFFVSHHHGKKWFDAWENLWVMDALLICGMTESARRILENVASLITRYGHLPPENRVYCLERTSPPVFPLMLKSFLLSTNETDFVKSLLPLAERDFRHWVMTRVQAVKTPFEVFLCALEEEVSPAKPRPEFYQEDLKRKLGTHTLTNRDITPSFILWDSDPPKEIISVQLSAVTEWASRVLGELSIQLGDPSMAGIYERISYEMKKSLRRQNYSRKKSGWYDVDPNKGYIRSSSFWPIYSGSDSWRNETKMPVHVDLSDPILVEVTVVSLMKNYQMDLAETLAHDWLNSLRPTESDLLTLSVAIRLLSLFPSLDLNETVLCCQPIHKVMQLPTSLMLTLSFTCCLLTNPEITEIYP